MAEDDRNDDPSASRRDFLKRAAAVAVTAASPACALNVVPPPQPGPPEEVDVVIVGTGFGAVVVATTLADAKANLPASQQPRVLMIERGTFWFTPERPLPDGFDGREDIQYWPAPDNPGGLLNFLGVVRTNSVTPKNPNSQPLYYYSMFRNVHIVTAGGVGGGSLVYSNVSLEPYFDPATNTYPVIDGWPLKLTQADYSAALGWMKGKRVGSLPGRDGSPMHVVTTLPPPAELATDANLADLSNPQNLTTLPAGNYEALYLPRSNAYRRAVRDIDPAWKAKMLKPWQPLPLQVSDFDWKSPFPRGARVCERQGRCFLGCLPGARHSLNKTLIKFWMANPRHTLRTMTRVTEIRKIGSVYEVVQEDVRTGGQRRTRAKVVVLGSGVLGTTELLLRSRKTGLSLSSKLGTRFSTNGDFSGFVVDVPKTLAGADNRVFPTKGPINTSHSMFKDGDNYVNVEDAGIPAMFAEVTRATVDVLKTARPGDPLLGKFIGAMSKIWFQREFPNLLPKASDPLTYGTDAEALANVFWFNCMGNDREFGTFDLDGNDKLTLDYPDPGQNPLFTTTRTVMSKLAEAMAGKYVDFPMWNKDLFGTRKLVVTHPLGGCPMAPTASEGVVDPQGRVFVGGSNPSEVHNGLFIADGSVLPGPVAVNPTLTIVAVCLKIAAGVVMAV